MRRPGLAPALSGSGCGMLQLLLSLGDEVQSVVVLMQLHVLLMQLRASLCQLLLLTMMRWIRVRVLVIVLQLLLQAGEILAVTVQAALAMLRRFFQMWISGSSAATAVARPMQVHHRRRRRRLLVLERCLRAAVIARLRCPLPRHLLTATTMMTTMTTRQRGSAAPGGPSLALLQLPVNCHPLRLLPLLLALLRRRPQRVETAQLPQCLWLRLDLQLQVFHGCRELAALHHRGQVMQSSMRS